ncbi:MULTISPECIES: hypothetical protein [Methylosinus]|uniref:Uncharacterized protein n=1 Tax=Methylosinus sporium TaxID=428 RepID=A0A549SCV1_METSR|nr:MULTISPECIES: hypothetical protein [Methylosinus]MBY6243931.1 hypothetical protein [Methylosinus sp. Sm6]TRL23867.1 hypothetical protein FM996_20765 [Methylosinus sporium]
MALPHFENVFASSVKTIDRHLGVGYAKNHPDLLGALLVAEAINASSEAIEDILRDIHSSMEELSTRLPGSLSDDRD